MGIGYVALGGFGAKCRTGWSGVDTPWTVMTTRAPAVLKKYFPQVFGFPESCVSAESTCVDRH